MQIKDRTFVVSGGSSGLGLATVQELHSQGAYIAILDYNEETGNAVASDLNERVLFCKADMSDPASTKDAVEQVLAWVKKTGIPIGGVVPAAGIGNPGQLINKKGESLPLERLEQVLNVNIRGVFDLIRLLLPSMVSNTPTDPDGERGVIIMISSAAAFDGQPGQLAYAASKGAIRSSTLVLARDLARYGIRCCTIAPGYFDSAMTRRASAKVRQSLEKVFEFPQRAGHASEFAATARHIIENPMLNGETIRLDGATRMASRMLQRRKENRREGARSIAACSPDDYLLEPMGIDVPNGSVLGIDVSANNHSEHLNVSRSAQSQPQSQPPVDWGRPACPLRSPLVGEDSILQQVCQQIATPHCDGRVADLGTHPWATVMEYQNTLQATGVLGELMGNYQHTNRMVQIQHAPDSHPHSGSSAPRTRRELELLDLDDDQIAFLNTKNVFHLPARDVCKELFERFFTFAHPYTPVLDRCIFLAQYDAGNHSSFVMQVVLANAVPYASIELIRRAGFSSHQNALREFNKRAVLLYNFNCEKQQLAILQGALLLGVQWNTHLGDKDYRYWMSQGVRIAMRMGLHRSHIQDELEAKFYALLKRIWCILWVRDVLLVTTGLVNERKVPDDCDTVELCEADWDEDTSIVPDDLHSCLPHVNSTQKQFLIHLSHLAVLGRRAHKFAFSRNPSQLDHDQAETILGALCTWRQQLPGELTITSTTSWSSHGIWTLVLAAWASRLECQLHRTMWRSRMQMGHLNCPISPGLRDSIFNLDAVIKRAVLHGLCKFMPLTVTTSAAFNVALAIELLCQSDISAGEKSVYEEAVRNGIVFLRDVQEIWATVRALLSLFAWVLARKALHFQSGLEPLEGSSTIIQNVPLPFTRFNTPSNAFGTNDDDIANALLFGNESYLGLPSWTDEAIFGRL